MENVKEMSLVGYYTFKSKDKSKTYYILQFLNSIVENDNNKSVLINIYVDKDKYQRVTEDYGIGSLLQIESNINYETNKVYYSVVL
jgi:hypothetical protein